MTTPHVGQIVILVNVFSNGLNSHPAIITRVWKYNEDTCEGMVNATLFPDAAAPSYHTSIPFFTDKGSADYHLKMQGSYSTVKIICYAKD